MTVQWGTFLGIAFMAVLVGGVVFLFSSIARQAASETPWSDRYRLRDSLPEGMVQDLRAARLNRNFDSGFGVRKDMVLSYVFGSTTVVHVGPGSNGEMQNDPSTDHGVEVRISRGSVYIRHGDIPVKAGARGLTITPHGSRFLARIDGKDLLVHCFHGESEIGVGKPPDYGWTLPLHAGRTYRFLDKGGIPAESDIPPEARAVDVALSLQSAAEAP